MAENFDLIFGRNASQQYAWNDADYQNGWETIGNNTPTAAQFDALQRRSDTKMKELNDELTPLVNADTEDSRQPSTTYSEGDIKYSPLLPTGWFLTCTTAGITSASEIVLPTPIAEGGTVTDGEVVWTIRKISSGADIPIATEETNGLMSAADKTKLDGVATGANNYSLPSATSSVRGGVTIGSNISSTGDKISVSGQNVQDALGFSPATRAAATQSAAGLMSAADKKKLDGVANNANNYSLPAATGSTRGGVTIGANISLSGDKISLTKGNVTNALGYTPPTHDYSLPAATGSTRGGVTIGSNINLSGDKISINGGNVTNALGYTPPRQDTTYGPVTSAANGLMTPAMLALLGSGGGIVAASLSPNGYVKFANGLIMQWGYKNTGNNQKVTITYPTPFTNFVIPQAIAVRNGNSGNSDMALYQLPTLTSAVFMQDGDLGFFWFAIGK